MATDLSTPVETTSGAATLEPTPSVPGDLAFHEELHGALNNARRFLFSQQYEDGYWVAELQGDTCLETEYILLKFILGQDDDPNMPQLANYIRRDQNPDGGWGMYPGGKTDISLLVKAYFVLKLLGDDPESPHMQHARQAILSNGGAERCNSFTSFYLAALGQIPYNAVPTIPPEIMLLPSWFYFNIYAMSAWSRTILIPLAIVNAHRPLRKLPVEKSIRELFRNGVPTVVSTPSDPGKSTAIRKAFILLDRFLKVWDRCFPKPFRKTAMAKAERWMCERFEGSDGLGAIFPPMVYALIALRCLGYEDDHPLVVEAWRVLDDLHLDDGDDLRWIQPCKSPVWDTAISLVALQEIDSTTDREAMERAADWLLKKECRRAGDWTVGVPNVEPGGWYFEFDNEFYPDVDDSIMVMIALARLGRPQDHEPCQRALKWVLAMQNDDGGWGAFDKNNDREILTQVPFADHNAMLDPSWPDISARVLEALSYYDIGLDHPQVQKAIQYIKSEQEEDGAWFGRWGVNYIYGTWQTLVGLAYIGEDMTQPYVQKAFDWLEQHQNDDGGWGETCDSYEDPSLRGQGPSTASQTAWALMGLMAGGDVNLPSLRRGMQWLIDHQKPDGSWEDEWWTGTGFPKVFYLKYHYYPINFPLMAIGRWSKMVEN